MNPLWNELASRAGRTLSGEQHALLGRYLDLLLEANERMNLTRITDPSAAEVQHVGDALTLLPLLPTDSHRLADVGTGGGVPGRVRPVARSGRRANFARCLGRPAADPGGGGPAASGGPGRPRVGGPSH